MTTLKRLHDGGQSIWLDAISRDMLRDGTLAHYIRDFSVTGLTSNPTIFQRFVASTNRYDDEIRKRLEQGVSAERLFFEFALQDIVDAADLLRPIFDATGGVDGFASIEVSPTLTDDTEGTIAEGRALFARADRPNVLIKVPATPAGLRAIEELLFAGVPINATLLFSSADYEATAEAYLRGIERRVEAGLEPNIASVSSLFISRWDAHTASDLPPELTNVLGIAVAQRAYRAYRKILASDRWRDLDRGEAIDAARRIEDRPQQVGRVDDVLQGELEEETLRRDPLLEALADLIVVPVRARHEALEDGRIRGEPRHGEVAGVVGERAVAEHVATDRVQPDALACVVELLECRHGPSPFSDFGLSPVAGTFGSAR